MKVQIRKLLDATAKTLKNVSGQGLVEYALILVLIAIVVIAMMKGVGSSTTNTFSKINSALQ